MANATITAPVGCQISTDNINWDTTITYTDCIGTTETVYVRVNSAVAGAYSEDIDIDCDGETASVAITATVSLPVILATPDAIICDGYANIRTDSETFSLSITGLATNCELDCSGDPGVYISLNNTTWTNTIDLGTLEDESVTVYVSVLSNSDVTSATILFTCDEG